MAAENPIYRSGATARAQGYPLSFNPNCFGSAAHARWSSAWRKENDRLAAVQWSKGETA